jgi:hypothetical protein
VASGPINVTGGAAQSITGALSAVASAGMTNNPEALKAVAGVLGNLASSQASSLVTALASLAQGAPPPAPATTSSPTIQTLVQIDPPGGSRLTTQSLTAPGSPSSFNPMPADLLPSNAAVVTQFFSLAFDPNGGANTTGVTRLAFSNPDGSPIPVENAVTPILFTLPAVDTSSGDEQAVCSYWDTVARNYSSQARGHRSLLGAHMHAAMHAQTLTSHRPLRTTGLRASAVAGPARAQPLLRARLHNLQRLLFGHGVEHYWSDD